MNPALFELFNENCINAVELSARNIPSSLGYPPDPKCDELTVIISKYSTFPSVQKNQGRFYLREEIVSHPVNTCEINKIIKFKIVYYRLQAPIVFLQNLYECLQI